MIHRDLIAAWLSDKAGFRGILTASLLGALTPGGPFLQFPIMATLLRAGAGIGPIISFITSWSLLGVNRVIIWEIPILGPKLTFARLIASLLVPVLLGSLGQTIYRQL